MPILSLREIKDKEHEGLFKNAQSQKQNDASVIVLRATIHHGSQRLAHPEGLTPAEQASGPTSAHGTSARHAQPCSWGDRRGTPRNPRWITS